MISFEPLRPDLVVELLERLRGVYREAFLVEQETPAAFAEALHRQANPGTVLCVNKRPVAGCWGFYHETVPICVVDLKATEEFTGALVPQFVRWLRRVWIPELLSSGVLGVITCARYDYRGAHRLAHCAGLKEGARTTMIKGHEYKWFFAPGV